MPSDSTKFEIRVIAKEGMVLVEAKPPLTSMLMSKEMAEMVIAMFEFAVKDLSDAL